MKYLKPIVSMLVAGVIVALSSCSYKHTCPTYMKKTDKIKISTTAKI